jgi:hypothetical protein
MSNRYNVYRSDDYKYMTLYKTLYMVYPTNIKTMMVCDSYLQDISRDDEVSPSMPENIRDGGVGRCVKVC